MRCWTSWRGSGFRWASTLSTNQMEGRTIVASLLGLVLLVLMWSHTTSKTDVSIHSSHAETTKSELFIVDGEVTTDETESPLDKLHSHHMPMDELMEKVKKLKADAEKVYLGKTVILDLHGQTGKASESHVLESSLPKGSRVLGPNSAMTMDYRPDRMNLMTDENHVVKSVSFG